MVALAIAAAVLSVRFAALERSLDAHGVGGLWWIKWMPAGAMVIFVLRAIGFARALRRLRRCDRGACLRCGYDLRATPERCPECGTVTTDPRPR